MHAILSEKNNEIYRFLKPVRFRFLFNSWFFLKKTIPFRWRYKNLTVFAVPKRTFPLILENLSFVNRALHSHRSILRIVFHLWRLCNCDIHVHNIYST